VAVVVGVVGVAWQGKSFSEVGGEILVAALGAMIAIVATFIGSDKDGPPK
jgi:hypothetical protein